MLMGMSGLSTALQDLVDRCRDAMLPPACVFCRAPVTSRGECCGDCARAIRIWPRACCRRCGRPLPPDIAPGPCGQCLKKAPPHARMESLYVYAGPVREAILDWKLRGRDAGVEWLLGAAAARLRDMFAPGDVLLPVPMPLARMRRAGRHHAADLCRAIARITGARVEWRWLRRAEDSGRQSERGRGERWQHARRAFRLDEVVDAVLPDGSRIWVADDIRTTGATLHWACKTLRPLARSARTEIHAFSLARTPEAR